MQDTLEQLLNHFYGLWRYRWVIMVTAWIVAASGWVVVSSLPDKYESIAQVYVDTDTILRPLLEGISVDSLDPNEQFGLMAKELLSRPNLENVARKVDLDIQATNDAEKEQIIRKLEKNIKIESMSTHSTRSESKPPNLYKLSVQYETPEMAYRIVQELLDTFVESSLSGNRTENISARKFIDKEIGAYELKLIEAEARLREFKSKNIKILPEQGSSYYQRLQTAQTNLETVELELREEKHRREELLRQLKNTSQIQQIVTEDGSQVLSPIDQRIVALQRRLDELLLTFTDEHPDVSEVKSSLAELQASKQAQFEMGKTDGVTGIQNPVSQRIQLALGEVEANIAAIEVRQKEFKKRVDDLQKQVETLPKVEAELQALNRDYDINRKNYDSLVERREAAKMGAAAEQTGEQVKIKVIEPPRLPTFPSGPNRLLFSSAVLLAAIGAGIGIAFLLMQIRPVFYSQKSIREVLGMPVLGTVSYIAQPEYLRKNRMTLIGYGVAGGALFIAYLGVMYFQIFMIAK
ncbi:MAG: Wzz/FepE/Etk N-terminal domain-containing protein [Gammaproteobacteria bacterium]|nr:Wzz/FepE/Etk N-terminal domain-containing protein [Gammaproteobacteria bacterium]